MNRSTFITSLLALPAIVTGWAKSEPESDGSIQVPEELRETIDNTITLGKNATVTYSDSGITYGMDRNGEWERL